MDNLDEWAKVGKQIEEGILQDTIGELATLQQDMRCLAGLQFLWTEYLNDPDTDSNHKEGVAHCLNWMDMVYGDLVIEETV